jgi:Clostripain family
MHSKGLLTRLCTSLLLMLLPHATLLEPALAATPAQWTFLVYMVGENDLEHYVSHDIETELGAVGSSADVHVMVLADRIRWYSATAGNWTGTKLFYVTKEMKATPEVALADWGERNMGDPQTLVDFVSYAMDHYPAERYALILWNHGWGWRPYQTMWDATSDDTLDLDELVAALQQTGPLAVIAYDACLMQDIEVLAALRPYTHVLVGSQDFVGYEGFRYEEALSALAANPTMSNEALGVTLARSMTDRTSSVVALNEDFDALVAALERWSSALLAGLPVYHGQYAKTYWLTQSFGDPLFVDLYDAATQLNTYVHDPAVRNAGQAVMDAMDKVLLYEWHRDFYRGTHGISIFWPQHVRGLDEPSSPHLNDFAYYRDVLEFSAMTHWDEFLAAYAGSTASPPASAHPLTPRQQAIEAVQRGAPGFGLPAARGYYSPATARKHAIQYPGEMRED